MLLSVLWNILQWLSLLCINYLVGGRNLFHILVFLVCALVWFYLVWKFVGIFVWWLFVLLGGWLGVPLLSLFCLTFSWRCYHARLSSYFYFFMIVVMSLTVGIGISSVVSALGYIFFRISIGETCTLGIVLLVFRLIRYNSYLQYCRSLRYLWILSCL